MDPSGIELFLNLLALFFCSVAVYSWDEVYGITKKGRISGGWVYLIAATILAVAGIYPTIAGFFYEIGPDFQRYWVSLSKLFEGVFLMVAGVIFYNTIYRSLRTRDLHMPEHPEKVKETIEGTPRSAEGPEKTYGISTEELFRDLLGRLSLYWGPDVSRQMLIQTLQGKVDERQTLKILSDYLPVTDEEKWKEKWAH